MAPYSLSKSETLRIATYNVRTLSENIHLHHLERELENIKWDVVGLSEVRRPGESLVQLKSGHLFFSRGPNKKQGGVALLVNKNLAPFVEEFEAVSDRVVNVRLRLHKHIPLQITQAYAPTSMSSQDEIEAFYDDLGRVEFNGRISFLVGDMNAKVGKAQNPETCVGNFGIGQRNDRGQDLANFATCRGLRIMNTFFKKRRKWTWRSPDFEYFNEIDYILTNRPDIVKDVKVTTRVDMGSDHRMVLCKLIVQSGGERSRRFTKQKKPCVSGLDVMQYQREISRELSKSPINRDDSLDKMYNSTASALLEVAKRSVGPSVGSGIFSRNTIELIKKRKTFPAPATVDQKTDYAELCRIIKKAKRDDQRVHQYSIIKEMTEKGKGFRAIDQKLQHGRSLLIGVLGNDGAMIRDRNRITQRAREYYQELYSSKSCHIEPIIPLDTPPEILPWEVERVILSLKSGKASGPDGVGNQMLKAAGPVIYTRLASVFSECLRRGSIPDKWNDAAIVLLHKKGNPHNLNNYRPISLLNCVYKVFTKLITNRIEGILDENQPPEQAGFRRGFSTTDHLQAVNQIIEKCNEYQIPLIMCFVDYAKAFDSVTTLAVVESIQNQGVHPAYVELFRNIYTNARAYIQLDRPSDLFSLRKGVRQGDTSSPKLFTAVLESVFRRLDWEGKGIVVNGKCLSHLRFADDIVLLSSCSVILQTMLETLEHAGNQSGLVINRTKTKVMANVFYDQILRLSLGNTSVEVVDSYIYLGQLIKMDPSMDAEISRRINIGWQAFGKASWLLRDKKFSLALRRKLYDQCILPSITYGCETWNLKKRMAIKLRSLQRAHERMILGVSLTDHKSSEWIREKTGLTDILETIFKRKWRWAGHVARMKSDRWTYTSTFWTPYDHRRRRGRPKSRWRDDLDSTFPQWHRMAQNRTQWKEAEEAYVRLRTFIGY